MNSVNIIMFSLLCFADLSVGRDTGVREPFFTEASSFYAGPLGMARIGPMAEHGDAGTTPKLAVLPRVGRMPAATPFLQLLLNRDARTHATVVRGCLHCLDAVYAVGTY